MTTDTKILVPVLVLVASLGLVKVLSTADPPLAISCFVRGIAGQVTAV